MIELKGKYNEAKIFTDNVCEKTISQILGILNREEWKDNKIRIMPDCHAGKGCVIGFTASLAGRVIPNLVGVDIGCGMHVTKLGKQDIDFKALDDFIREKIPYGTSVNERAVSFKDKNLKKEIEQISKLTNSEYKRHLASICSLGGGNHFVEINEDRESNRYLVIHSGSRNFGNVIAKYHQNIAVSYCQGKVKELRTIRNIECAILSERGETEKAKETKKTYDSTIEIYNVPKDLSFLEYRLAKEYLKDMEVAQKFAEVNRNKMAEKIVTHLGLEYDKLEKFTTIHNYINFEDNIIRKGAISAKRGEKVIIPINMKEGSILAVGKGNKDWNESAPHGAGRVMSRSQAKENIDLEEFKQSMTDVWTTSVKSSTMDESPMAYKPMKEIIENIGDTVDIIDVIKPLYNFKA